MTWESFRDASYFDLWCVREKGERQFGHGFHLVNGDEAKALAELLSAPDREPLARIPWHCFGCVAEDALQTHWLTSVGCLHHDNGTGDNAASCWCGWNGPRVPNVGEAVRTWAEHTSGALAAALASTTLTSPDGRRMAETENTGSGRKPDQQVPGSNDTPSSTLVMD